MLTWQSAPIRSGGHLPLLVHLILRTAPCSCCTLRAHRAQRVILLRAVAVASARVARVTRWRAGGAGGKLHVSFNRLVCDCAPKLDRNRDLGGGPEVAIEEHDLEDVRPICGIFNEVEEDHVLHRQQFLCPRVHMPISLALSSPPVCPRVPLPSNPIFCCRQALLARSYGNIVKKPRVACSQVEAHRFMACKHKRASGRARS